jgi:hypothetical protein
MDDSFILNSFQWDEGVAGFPKSDGIAGDAEHRKSFSEIRHLILL